MSQLPQDVEEFIAAKGRMYLLTSDEKFITEDDLRAWMTDHVRVPAEVIESIRRTLPGCSNHGCAFANRPPGSMGTNAMCNCVGNATRQQLIVLNRKITALLNASKVE